MNFNCNYQLTSKCTSFSLFVVQPKLLLLFVLLHLLIFRRSDDENAQNAPVSISAYSKWDSISPRLTPSERPVVLHRAGTTNTANPFGSTFCYGYQDIIFEVSFFSVFGPEMICVVKHYKN